MLNSVTQRTDTDCMDATMEMQTCVMVGWGRKEGCVLYSSASAKGDFWC